VTSGTERALAATVASEASPRFSRDGKRIAFLISSDAPPRWAGAHRVAITALEGGTPRILPATPDEDPSELMGWSGDGQHLLLSEARGTTGGLYAMKVEDGSLLRLNTGTWTFATGSMVGSGENVALDPSGRFLGLVLQSSTEAPLLAFSPIHAFAPKILARPNADLPILPLPRTEIVHWKGAGGLEIEGLLSLPADAKAGAKLPLILSIHGGPSQCYGETYPASPSQYPLAALAAKGFAILRPNIRGSHGYGRAFRFGNEQDWGGKDFDDLMAGVDKVIAMGVADPERLGVMGWSYGGFMTSWILTRTHRFKAASVGAAVTDLVSFTGTTDIPGFIPDYFGGESWDLTQRWLDHSPVFQVKGVKTPTLIQHCEGDPRVPIGQGYEYFNALQRQGVEVRMQVAPRQNHGPTEPRALLRFAEANLDWFSAKLKP
jgi:dipeptidyl aminopeptidase/acylaminoacyl peptidase